MLVDFMSNFNSSAHQSQCFICTFSLQCFGFHHDFILYYVRPYCVLDFPKGFLQKVSVISANSYKQDHYAVCSSI